MNNNVFRLDSSWNGIKTIVPYGYGRIGRRVLKKLMDFFEIPFVIDNNTLLQNNDSNIRIITFDDARELINGRKIVILTLEQAYSSIKQELINNGLVEDKDFTIFSRFIGEYFLKNEDKLYLSKLDTIITSRCTLKCPHCAGFIPYCRNQKDISYEELCKNFDAVFSIVDYVVEYSLLGGEPLIHGELIRIIDYLKENYKDKIGKLVLISNGNVNLSEDVLLCLKKNNVQLAISNYTSSVDYSKRYNDMLRKLDNNGIVYTINEELVWKDPGYPDNPADIRDCNVRKHMKMCGHTCYSSQNGKLYYCDAMVSAEIMTNYETLDDDIIDIKKELNCMNARELKYRIFAYFMGEINEKGYPSFCALCKGLGEDNTSVVKAGM